MEDVRVFADCGIYISYADGLLEWERNILIETNACSSLVIWNLLSFSLRESRSR